MDDIVANANKYLKLTPSLFDIGKRNQCVKETMEIVWADTKKNGISVPFCGGPISIPFNSNNMPKIKWDEHMASNGNYDSETHTITLNKSLLAKPKELYTTLVHEVRHAIQNEVSKDLTQVQPNSPEYYYLSLIKAEVAETKQMNFMDFDIGNRLYAEVGSNYKTRDPIESNSHLLNNFELFYNLVQTEWDARSTEIQWAKQSGLFDSMEIAIMEQHEADVLTSAQEKFFIEYLSHEAVLSLVQRGQLDTLYGILPDKKLVAEADFVYEFACTVSTANGKMDLVDYNKHISIAGKEQFMFSHGQFVNYGKERVETLPITEVKMLGFDEPTLQTPAAMIYLIPDRKESYTPADWEMIFSFAHSRETDCMVNHLKDNLQSEYDVYKEKYYTRPQKALQLVKDAETNYKAKYAFDLSIPTAEPNKPDTFDKEQSLNERER